MNRRTDDQTTDRTTTTTTAKETNRTCVVDCRARSRRSSFGDERGDRDMPTTPERCSAVVAAAAAPVDGVGDC